MIQLRRLFPFAAACALVALAAPAGAQPAGDEPSEAPWAISEDRSAADTDADPRIEKILRALDISYTIDEDADYRVHFDMGRDRSQVGFVVSETSSYQGAEVREVWSIGYQSKTDELPASVANRLLEDSGRKKMGGWARSRGRAYYVVKLPADADQGAVLRALQMTLESADEMEEELTGDRDEF